MTLSEQHPYEINTWLSQVSRDVDICPVSDEQAAAACLNWLFVWVTCSKRGASCYFFLLEYGKLVGWKPSPEQWVTAMRWISQPGCAFLARQRNPVHSNHTDTLNTVYGSLAGALCLCSPAWKRPEWKWTSFYRTGNTNCWSDGEYLGWYKHSRRLYSLAVKSHGHNNSLTYHFETNENWLLYRDHVEFDHIIAVNQGPWSMALSFSILTEFRKYVVQIFINVPKPKLYKTFWLNFENFPLYFE